MKVSKLFHWLYAGLMLAPLIAVGVKCLYVSFNKNAKDSYYGETINNEEVITINTLNSDIQGKHIYIGSFTSSLTTNISGGSNKITFSTLYYNNNTYTNVVAVFWKDANTTSTYINMAGVISNLNTQNANFNGIVSSFVFQQSVYDSFSSKFYYKEYNKYSYLDNVFYYSVDQVTSSDLFSWANNSFLVDPFRYIGNLFGVPNDNAIYTFLSYWLDISIIWLVFDLIMYVPLLVHRWIDKGVIE